MAGSSSSGSAAASSAAATTPIVPRAASSLIVLRDSAEGMQVLLLRRAERPGDQNGGATVFPGGLLDPTDRGHDERCDGLDDAAASARLNLPADGLRYYVAALRECFEEAGLLFAVDLDGRPVDMSATASDALWTLRHELHDNKIGIADICARLGVKLAVGQLAYYSHWITPVGMPKIFDTRFFMTKAPEDQAALHDAGETVELLWLTPAEALDKGRGLKLLNVTERTLRHLDGFDSADQAIAATLAVASVPVTRPRIRMLPDGKRQVLHPGEPGFDDVPG